MNPRPRWISAPLAVAGSSGMVVLLLLGVSELHCPRMIACNATPTPVLTSGTGPELPGHLEPTDGAVAPDPAPVLLNRKPQLALLADAGQSIGDLSMPTADRSRAALFELPLEPIRDVSAARSPPSSAFWLVSLL